LKLSEGFFLFVHILTIDEIYSTLYNFPMTRKIDAKVGIYSNAKYGDFKEVWDEIHKSKDCITVD